MKKREQKFLIIEKSAKEEKTKKNEKKNETNANSKEIAHFFIRWGVSRHPKTFYD